MLILKTIAIRLIQFALFFLPLKKNRIMFYANNRKGYVCNPVALMNYLLEHYPGQYDIIWVTRFPETCESNEQITVVKQRSLSYYKLFIQTKFFITNDMVDETLVKKKGQIFLTTWHGGGAYKKVGKSTLYEDKTFAKNFAKWYGRLDYFVSSCKQCTDMYAEAFGLETKQFLETGTPRNDIFFRNEIEIAARVKQFYNVPEQTHLLLFAPSFQMTAPQKEKYDREVLVQVARELEEKTGEPWIILYRSHYLREEDKTEQAFLKDGNAYYEMQDLLYAADVLVTDYSSCIWDFSLTKRPIFVMENRLAEYEKEDRGFFVPYQKWPYIKINQLEDLTTAVLNHRKDDFSSAYEKHWEEMGTFETGTACKSIINTVIKGD